MAGLTHLPIVDVAPLLDRSADPAVGSAVGDEIDAACRSVGFFGIVGHGIPAAAQAELDAASRRFFALPDPVKAEIAMAEAGAAWRGWFPVGAELTSGRPDRKEGLYFGSEHPPDHPRVRAGVPLHGANLFPASVPELRIAVLNWLGRLHPVADAVMRGVAIGLGMEPVWFERHLTGDPTVLFRIFHYPPAPPPTEAGATLDGVGEHTDYGLLTLLAQDTNGGLEVRTPGGEWFEVDPQPGLLVCNLGDMLERLTGGRYRSTPHRVRNRSSVGRLSFPYFFDPSWDATVPALPVGGDAGESVDAAPRWDGADVTAWEGTYGDYLTAKVSRVFPELFAAQSGSSSGTIRP